LGDEERIEELEQRVRVLEKELRVDRARLAAIATLMRDELAVELPKVLASVV
jgi:chaperonin cofactor prefoldin